MNAVVLCVDYDSFISALVAFALAAELCPEKGKADMAAACADFERAFAMYQAADAKFTTPALLRRQAE